VENEEEKQRGREQLGEEDVGEGRTTWQKFNEETETASATHSQILGDDNREEKEEPRS